VLTRAAISFLVSLEHVQASYSKRCLIFGRWSSPSSQGSGVLSHSILFALSILSASWILFKSSSIVKAFRQSQPYLKPTSSYMPQRWGRFDGTMDMKKRGAVISEFKAPGTKPKILIISLKAGGVGLNVNIFLFRPVLY
jgi:hypothetical protein